VRTAPPAKEAIVPQIVRRAQHQPSRLLLAQPPTFHLRHILKTLKENVDVDHQVHTAVSQIQMALEV
jgi:hypothetical protein